MLTRDFLKSSVCAVLLALGCASSAVAADVWPTKPIHMVMPAATGGGIDIVGRLVAQKMGEFLGQPVIVDSRAGAETLLGTRYAKNQPPDGYTIIAESNGFLTMDAVKLDPGYDALKDFQGVGLMQTSPFVFETSGALPDKTLLEFIARAKANPGKFTYASGGVGSPPHITLATLMKMHGIEATHVLYKGNGAALPDLAGGRLNLMSDTYISSLAYYQNGSVRPLAVTSAKRMDALPDVPTLKELGIDYTYEVWLGIMAPRGVPKDVMKRLSDAVLYATSSPDLVARMKKEGSTPGTMTSDQFDEFVAKDRATALPQILALGIEKQ
jgi:tripartite-type tricarboxylate transporter receptor subunit TctC